MHRPTLALLVALAGSTPLACAQVHIPNPLEARAEQMGPPPHAPAHGYRHKHHAHGQDVELVFDSAVGLYVVVGWPEHYWHDGHYYRHVDGAWQVSVQLDDGWSSASGKRLPPGLAKKHRGRKGPHPASRRR